MIKYIKRISDNKFLQSVTTDTWVDNVNDAFQMTYRECEDVKTELLNTYSPEQIKDVVDFKKSKPISEEEKQELLNLLKK